MGHDRNPRKRIEGYQGGLLSYVSSNPSAWMKVMDAEAEAKSRSRQGETRYFYKNHER
jgi:hypothetical protein